MSGSGSGTPPTLGLSPLVAAASTASMAAQARYLWAVRLELAFLLLGAAAGMIWTEVPGPVPASLSAFGFVGALVASGYAAKARPERGWYDGRAAAESAKTLAWRYAVGGRPFPLDMPSEAVDKGFIAALQDVMGALPYVAADPNAGPQITSDMRKLREAELPERRERYETARVAGQQSWYAARARFNESRVQRWRAVVVMAELVGVAAGIAAAAGWLRVDLVGLVAAFAAATTAWLQVKQHDSLARSYSVASQELSSVRSLIRHQTDESTWADFVDQAEEAISREHTLWRASRGVLPREGARRPGATGRL